ncbi:HAD family hydrolase [Pedobacter cryoconitis]|uniref:Putative hydrolase of the HAD superfamily n=1 Tax=Pedobacter cryoconitis TaxID=188932 RepID=A0A7X0J4D2_9SPHI|nr:HAD hydrolase-like protein [Pedobacter cryoconitis]MBB6500931.1 putative hydrolase of the HAD superfamily [Pedobacter cryoconitis]
MKNLALIYDLDDTIIPTRSIPSSTFKPVFDAIKYANQGVVPPNLLEQAFDDLWRMPFDIVASNFGFTDSMITAGRGALLNTDYQLTLVPFDDYQVVKEIMCKRFLVTTGITKLQQAKINSIFKDGDFDEIIIDDPYQENRLGKQNIFADIANRHEIEATQMWIIGDNPESEIKAGNALGMTTVQILRPGIKKTENSTYIINTFHELKDLIEKLYV